MTLVVTVGDAVVCQDASNGEVEQLKPTANKETSRKPDVCANGKESEETGKSWVYLIRRFSFDTNLFQGISCAYRAGFEINFKDIICC